MRQLTNRSRAIDIHATNKTIEIPPNDRLQFPPQTTDTPTDRATPHSATLVFLSSFVVARPIKGRRSHRTSLTILLRRRDVTPVAFRRDCCYDDRQPIKTLMVFNFNNLLMFMLTKGLFFRI